MTSSRIRAAAQIFYISDFGSGANFGSGSYLTRVSEPACSGATPAPGIFYPEPAPAPGKR